MLTSLCRFQSSVRNVACILGALAWACGDSAGPPQGSTEWTMVQGDGVRLYHKSPDRTQAASLLAVGEAARRQIESFTGEAFADDFDLRIYPDREEFEAYWREVGFTPQCWMIARATRTGIEMLAPRAWAADGCGHDGGNSTEVQRVMSHEAMHVYHARVNLLPEVNHVAGLKWLNEGVAVYSAQQLDASMRNQAAQFAAGDLAGVSLSSLGLTAVGYAVGGSIAEFIDQSFGRAALLHALRAPSTTAVLDTLNISESRLLLSWKASVTGP